MEKLFPAYTGNEPYVFVCYAHEDREIIYPEMEWLRQQGINLWYDEGISAGQNWRGAIGDSLLGASHVLFYISGQSLKSEHCNREINLAIDKGKDVIPVYLEEVELTSDLMVGLNRVHALHRDQDGSYQQHLLNALGQSISIAELQKIVKTKDTDQGFQFRPSINKGIDRKFVYATFGLVLLVAGFQVSNQFIVPNGANLVTGSATSVTNITRTNINLGLLDRHPTTRMFTNIDLSADGSQLAYTSFSEGKELLYIRELDELEPRLVAELPGHLSGANPFFSPDGEWLAFHNANTLMKISVLGGPVQPLSDNVSVFEIGGAWSDDQTILFSLVGGFLSSVSAGGGEAEEIQVDTGGFAGRMWPSPLPGGTAVLLTVGDIGSPMKGRGIYLLDRATGKTRNVIQDGHNARYVPSGHIVFMRSGTLWASPFSLERLQITGAEVPVQTGIETNSIRGVSAYTFSDNGRFIYLPGTDTSYTRAAELVWVDREGHEEPLELSPLALREPRISPDGQRLVVTVRQPNSNRRDLWIHDFISETYNPITFFGDARNPLWTLDGERLLFERFRGGSSGIWTVNANGTGQAKQLTASARGMIPGSLSPDGAWLVYTSREARSYDLYMLDMADITAAPRALLTSEFSETTPAISPNGQWMAYTSNESGIQQVYVRPFPDVESDKIAVSVTGGQEPLWSDDGKSLYYLSPIDNSLVSVTVSTESGFDISEREVLYSDSSLVIDEDWPKYAVDSTNQRFLVLVTKTVEDRDMGPQFTSLVVVENWFEELKRLAPPDPQ